MIRTPRHSFLFDLTDSFYQLILWAPSLFPGEEVVFPMLARSKLPGDNLLDIWASNLCKRLKTCLENRVKTHDRVLASSDFGPSLLKPEEAFQSAIEAMPDAPEGCRICHYPYGHLSFFRLLSHLF